MEYVRCIICGEVNTTFLYTKNYFKIVKCKNCCLIYVNPRSIQPIFRKTCYNEYFDSNKFKTYSQHYLDIKSAEQKTFKKRFKLIENHKKTGRLLDVGCSIGTMLEIAREKGWDTFGIDLDHVAVEYCKEKKINVKLGKLEDMRFPSGFFDVIVMNHVIEHIPDLLRNFSASLTSSRLHDYF